MRHPVSDRDCEVEPGVNGFSKPTPDFELTIFTKRFTVRQVPPCNSWILPFGLLRKPASTRHVAEADAVAGKCYASEWPSAVILRRLSAGGGRRRSCILQTLRPFAGVPAGGTGCWVEVSDVQFGFVLARAELREIGRHIATS